MREIQWLMQDSSLSNSSIESRCTKTLDLETVTEQFARQNAARSKLFEN